ncbi:MAG: alpha-2-macroglobulin family protein [Rubrivivax sp.]
MPAELALSVVDDTVVSFADDKSGHLLSKLLLEPELPGKVEEPNFYLDLTEAKSALALDLLMGTRGYRRFDWVQVLRPPLDLAMAARAAGRGGQAAIAALDAPRELRVMPAPVPMAMPRAGMAAPPPPPAPPAPPAPPPPMVARQEMAAAAPPACARQHEGTRRHRSSRRPHGRSAGEAGRRARRCALSAADARLRARRATATPRSQRGGGRRADRLGAGAGVPDPCVPACRAHRPARRLPRDGAVGAGAEDEPARGKAQVKFTLSDAVTSFRVFAEGVSVAGGGLPGRSETVFKSTLPFSLAAKLPLEISAGDRPLIPITLSNDSERSLDVKLDARFGALLKAVGEVRRSARCWQRGSAGASSCRWK